MDIPLATITDRTDHTLIVFITTTIQTGPGRGTTAIPWAVPAIVHHLKVITAPGPNPGPAGDSILPDAIAVSRPYRHELVVRQYEVADTREDQLKRHDQYDG